MFNFIIKYRKIKATNILNLIGISGKILNYLKKYVNLNSTNVDGAGFMLSFFKMSNISLIITDRKERKKKKEGSKT